MVREKSRENRHEACERVRRYGAYYSAERNGTEHLIPQNTYFAEHIEMGPKQLPSLVAII